ncbi:MAG: tRNA adenosine(34) deaminase TadA [Actinomycetota bacterium]|jgi:tRNA(adenine34) deaminase
MTDATTAEHWMRAALEEAAAAVDHGDVPVGAIVVAPDGTELGRGHNRREQRADPTAHAELEALRAAAATLGTWRLDGCTLVVTLEPCPMCAGALVQSRVAHLVFGADDPKAGAVTSLFDLVRDPRLPHRVEVQRGVLAAESAALLRSFFTPRRYTPPRQGARVDEWGGLENR